MKFFLLKSKIHKIHELGAFPNRGGGGGSIECILVPNLPWSTENTFYFETFFLNSKFHEIRELGAIFTYWGGRKGVISCISVLNCSMKDQDYFLLRNVLPELEISRNT